MSAYSKQVDQASMWIRQWDLEGKYRQYTKVEWLMEKMDVTERHAVKLLASQRGNQYVAMRKKIQ